MEALIPLIDTLAEQQWVETLDFFPTSTIEALSQEIRELERNGALRSAKIGNHTQEQDNAEIRQTQILWFDPDNLTSAQEAFWSVLKDVRLCINRTCFLSLSEFECHYAVYPPGAFYRRHLDQFRSDDRRLISFLLYLNEDWKEQDGGALRIYIPGTSSLEEHAIDVRPDSGRVVLFQSGALEHEVLPTQRKRYGIVGWMKTRANSL